MERVTVEVPGRAYDVVIGAGMLDRADELVPAFPSATHAFVLSDRVVGERWFPVLAEALQRCGLHCVPLTVPAGEAAKSLDVYGTLLHQLATQEAHRADPVIALGGGSTGDVAGFVASTYMRGMPLVQVPTTLTAQVDAAIGGKTAVNLPEGKNLVGTFHQPVAVLCDVDVLATLADRDFRSGLAEVAKVALTLDPELLEMLERDPGPLLARVPEALEPVVTRCVRAKARAVGGDERDTGDRLILNYGHTLGHALERLDAFAGRSHGEAIAVGMVFAARLAEVRGLCAEGLAARTTRLLTLARSGDHGSAAAGRRRARRVPDGQEVRRRRSVRVVGGRRTSGRGAGRAGRGAAARARGDGGGRMNVVFLFGPNLGALGRRDPELYGSQTLQEIMEEVGARATELGHTVRWERSDHEGDLIGWLLSAAEDGAEAVVMNPGALSHYSYALRDAVEACGLPVIEVHMSNIYAREGFRRTSVISPVCRASICGLGAGGYHLALEAMPWITT